MKIVKRALEESPGTANFGPWTTALDTGPGLGLSTFWQRRMAMITTLRGSNGVMSRWMKGLLVLAVAIVVGGPVVRLSSPPLRAEEAAATANEAKAAPTKPAVEFLPPRSPAEEKILAELEQPTVMEFVATPLADVVAFLEDKHRIPIQLDGKALEEAGLGSDTPVTRTLKAVSLRSALGLVLGALDLTYIIKDEVLLITTKDVAETELITRVYPVGDLVNSDDYTSLTKAITSTVGTQTWHEVGGPGQLATVAGSRSLVISQTLAMHEEILRLLRSLREAKHAYRSDPAKAK